MDSAQSTIDVATTNSGTVVREYCNRLKVSNTIFESAMESYNKVSVSKWYRGQIPAAIAVASSFNACRWKTNVELYPLSCKLNVPVDQVIHALWVVEASIARTDEYRPSPKVTYGPPSSDRKQCYYIGNAAGVAEPKSIMLLWTWPERLGFTLEGHYDTKSPHLTETYNRVFREMETASKKAAVQQPKTFQLVEEIQPLKVGNPPKTLETSKYLLKTNTASKKDAVPHSKKTTELVEEVQPLKATKSTNKVEPVKGSIKTDAASKNDVQQPKKTIPLVEEVRPLKAANPSNKLEPLEDLVSKEAKKVQATINAPPEAIVAPDSAKTKSSKKRAATKKTRSIKKVEKDEDEEWDIIDSTDDDEKDKDWVEVSGRDLMAEKNEPMGWKRSVRRWFG